MYHLSFTLKIWLISADQFFTCWSVCGQQKKNDNMNNVIAMSPAIPYLYLISNTIYFQPFNTKIAFSFSKAVIYCYTF